MIPEELEKCIEKVKSEGRIPFFVNATSGSTVLGAYDDLDRLSDVCRLHTNNVIFIVRETKYFLIELTTSGSMLMLVGEAQQFSQRN